MDSESQEMLIEALKKTRSIEPWNNNWILFPSMIEAFLLDVTGEYDEDKLFHGVNTYMNHWYCGDGHYGDLIRVALTIQRLYIFFLVCCISSIRFLHEYRPPLIHIEPMP